eukprot:m.161692 g.161692  ORF g.161692 m.161692 type:complete len:1543 (-) comp14364_c2_seq1:375-5003(-)
MSAKRPPSDEDGTYPPTRVPHLMVDESADQVSGPTGTVSSAHGPQTIEVATTKPSTEPVLQPDGVRATAPVEKTAIDAPATQAVSSYAPQTASANLPAADATPGTTAAKVAAIATPAPAQQEPKAEPVTQAPGATVNPATALSTGQPNDTITESTPVQPATAPVIEAKTEEQQPSAAMTEATTGTEPTTTNPAMPAEESAAASIATTAPGTTAAPATTKTTTTSDTTPTQPQVTTTVVPPTQAPMINSAGVKIEPSMFVGPGVGTMTMASQAAQQPKQRAQAVLAPATPTTVTSNTATAPTPVPVQPTASPVQQSPTTNGVAAQDAAAAKKKAESLKVEDALSYLDKVKLHFGSKPQVYNKFLKIMKDFKSQKITTPDVIKSVSQLFEGHADLIVGFNTFLPPGYKIEIPDRSQPRQIVVSQPRKNLEFSHAIRYVNKIKERFKTQEDVYKSFRRILDTYQRESKSINEVYSQLAKLFENDPDLLSEFSQFLPEAVPAAQAYEQEKRRKKQQARRAAEGEPSSKRSKDAGRPKVSLQSCGLVAEELAFFEKIKKVLRPAEVYDNFLRCLSLYSHEIINVEELLKLVSNFLVKHPDLFDWFKSYVGVPDPDRPEHHPHDLDLATCELVNLSYRTLPAEYRKRVCTGRKDLAPSILRTLNDSFVSFPSWTSEDNQFVTGKKNQHEDALFKCEDERFELDRILQTNMATIQVLEVTLGELKAKPADQQKAFKFDIKTLGGRSETIHVGAIKRLYGERTPEVLAALKRSPLQHIPSVLKRLKQKQKEWREVQRQWNEAWREIISTNYLRALDQRGMAFKKSDTASIKTKAIRQQFREQREAYIEYQSVTERTETTGKTPPPPARKTFNLPKHVDVRAEVAQVVSWTSSRTTDRAELQDLVAFLLQFVYGTIPVANEVEAAAAQAAPAADGSAADGSAAETAQQPADTAAATASTMDQSADGAASDSSVPAVAASIMTKVKLPSAVALAPQPICSFLTNGKWAALFVQFILMVERLSEVKLLCEKIVKEAETHASKPVDLSSEVAVALNMPYEDIEYSDYFQTIMNTIQNLLECQIDNAKYEDTLRRLISVKAYKLYTMDKLVSAFVKQAKSVMQDSNCQALKRAFHEHFSKKTDERDYETSIVDLLDDKKAVYMVQMKQGEITVELLHGTAGVDDIRPPATETWLSYVKNYTQYDRVQQDILKHQKSATHLKRSIKKAGYTEETSLNDVLVQNFLELQFPPDKFTLTFTPKSWDVVYRAPKHSAAASAAAASATEEQRQARYQALLKAKSNITPEEVESFEAWLAGLGDAAYECGTKAVGARSVRTWTSLAPAATAGLVDSTPDEKDSPTGGKGNEIANTTPSAANLTEGTVEGESERKAEGNTATETAATTNTSTDTEQATPAEGGTQGGSDMDTSAEPQENTTSLTEAEVTTSTQQAVEQSVATQDVAQNDDEAAQAQAATSAWVAQSAPAQPDAAQPDASADAVSSGAGAGDMEIDMDTDRSANEAVATGAAAIEESKAEQQAEAASTVAPAVETAPEATTEA